MASRGKKKGVRAYVVESSHMKRLWKTSWIKTTPYQSVWVKMNGNVDNDDNNDDHDRSNISSTSIPTNTSAKEVGWKNCKNSSNNNSNSNCQTLSVQHPHCALTTQHSMMTQRKKQHQQLPPQRDSNCNNNKKAVIDKSSTELFILCLIGKTIPYRTTATV